MRVKASPNGREQTIKTSSFVRLGLFVFLLLMTYDGALRKWIIPGAERIMFVAKDLLLLVIYAFCVMLLEGNRSFRAKRYLPRVISGFLAAYGYFAIVGVFNPQLPNLAVGLWGIKSHILYASLILSLPLAFATVDELFTALARVFPIIVVPIFVISMLQLTSSPDAFINQQVRGGIDGIAYFGEERLVRIAGTFSYIAGMAEFVKVSTLIGLGLYLYGCRERLFLFSFALCLLLLPATGSRAVILVVAVGALMMLVASAVCGTLSLKRFGAASAVLFLLGCVSYFVQDGAWLALQQRTEENFTEGLPRLVTAFTNAFEFFDEAGLGGLGTGAANLGAVGLAPNHVPFSWLPFGAQFEEESGRIVIELGISGWLVSLALRIALCLWAIRLSLVSFRRSLRAAAIVTLPILAVGVHQGNGVFAATYMAVSYWFCVAVLCMIARENSSTFRGGRVGRRAFALRRVPNRSPRAPNI